MSPQAPHETQSRKRSRRSLRLRLGLLTACLAGLVAYLLLSGGGTQRSSVPSTLACAGAGTPQVQSVAPGELGALRDSVVRVLPGRVGRLYEEGTVSGANLWSDESPTGPAVSTTARRSGGYEMRWWAPNGDDLVADVLQFASSGQAADFMQRAAERRCGHSLIKGAADRPPQGRNLAWSTPTASPRPTSTWHAAVASTESVTSRPASSSAIPRRRGCARPSSPSTRSPACCRAPIARAKAAVSRPERALRVAVALLAALAVGCGKSNLIHDGTTSASTAADSSPSHTKTPAPAPVAVPLKLTAARAALFAQAVNLSPVDVPGSRRAPLTPSIESRQEENLQCSHAEGQAIGGGRSQRLDRGHQLEAESISSSVIVMSSEKAARTDLAYAESPAGLHCYTKLLSHKLERESTSSVAVGRVTVQRLKLRQEATGIRITARIAGVKSGLALNLYVDAVAFQYGPAEVELYATSFVQPVPPRTEQELIELMRARARLNPL